MRSDAKMGSMTIDDPVLPAAAHLTGPYADDVLRPAVERAGGRLRSARCTGIQYLPRSALVAQFRTEISWSGREPVRETIVAAATVTGPPAGTIPVFATHEGGELEVGVWRWPFDPELPALERAVRRSAIATLLGDAGHVIDPSELDLTVVAYRPMERAVVRVRAPSRSWYLKIVRPARAPGLVDRHAVLAAGGLPVATVDAADASVGWLATAELVGPTLRELIKSRAQRWVDGPTIRSLVDRVAAIDPDLLPATRSRVLDAPAHAAMLATVVPDQATRLAELGAAMSALARESGARRRTLVHGDLHEGQIVVGDGRITGLLDVDDIGRGDPIDDAAVLVGHLRYRAMATPNDGGRIRRLADDVATAFESSFDRGDIERVTAAVLVGLATGPFRLQHDDWPDAAHRTLALVDEALREAG